MAKPKSKVSRRQFLGVAAATASAGALGCGPNPDNPAPATAATPFGGTANTVATLESNVYTKVLGIRPHLGAHEHISRLGGGRMTPEVLAAMAEANDYFVDMHELNDAAGKRLAELLGAEAAMVTCGGFSGLLLGAAACLTGSDPEKITALPAVTWPRRECLIQTAQKFDYDRAYRAAGATIVSADRKPDLLARLGSKTALIAALSESERQGIFAPPIESHRAPPPDPHLVPPVELVAMGKQAGVPVLIDMASDLPPWGNLQRYLAAGADLLVLSGGKTIGGPQATGVLLGRKDLIAAARLNASPNDNIGRGMKVGKEEVVGLVVAVEQFMKRNHQAENAQWEARSRRIVAALQDVPGLKATVAANTAGYLDADLSWDEATMPLDRDRLRQELSRGTPRVQLEVIITQDQGTRTWHATARTRLLRDGEELLVARRLREVFKAAAASTGQPG